MSQQLVPPGPSPLEEEEDEDAPPTHRDEGGRGRGRGGGGGGGGRARAYACTQTLRNVTKKNIFCCCLLGAYYEPTRSVLGAY